MFSHHFCCRFSLSRSWSSPKLQDTHSFSTGLLKSVFTARMHSPYQCVLPSWFTILGSATYKAHPSQLQFHSSFKVHLWVIFGTPPLWSFPLSPIQSGLLHHLRGSFHVTSTPPFIVFNHFIGSSLLLLWQQEPQGQISWFKLLLTCRGELCISEEPYAVFESFWRSPCQSLSSKHFIPRLISC